MTRTKWIIAGVAVIAWPMMAAQGAEPKDKVAPGDPTTAAAPSGAQRQADAVQHFNGTWTIELTPMAGDKSKQPIEDTVQFDKGRVVSTALNSDGYIPTNATVTVGDDGVAVWETMQSSEGKGVVFWRGELRGQTMTGIMSKHPAQGLTEDYTFSGKKTSETATVPVPATAQSPATAAPVTATAATTTPAAPATPTAPPVEPAVPAKPAVTTPVPQPNAPAATPAPSTQDKSKEKRRKHGLF